MERSVYYVGGRDDVANRLEVLLERRPGRFRFSRFPDADSLLTGDPERAPNCVVCEFPSIERADVAVVDAIREIDPDLPVLVWDDASRDSAASRTSAIAPTEYVPLAVESDPIAP